MLLHTRDRQFFASYGIKSLKMFRKTIQAIREYPPGINKINGGAKNSNAIVPIIVPADRIESPIARWSFRSNI